MARYRSYQQILSSLEIPLSQVVSRALNSSFQQNWVGSPVPNYSMWTLLRFTQNFAYLECSSSEGCSTWGETGLLFLPPTPTLCHWSMALPAIQSWPSCLKWQSPSCKEAHQASIPVEGLKLVLNQGLGFLCNLKNVALDERGNLWTAGGTDRWQ